MAKYIAHSAISENGTIYGNPGDQTGKEVCIVPFYIKPWGHVIRINEEKVRVQFANNMIDIANNDAIGYCQSGRNSLLTEATKVKFDFTKITTKCECDCSSAVTACLLGAIYTKLGEAAYNQAYNVLVVSGNCATTKTLRSRMTTLNTKKIISVTVYTSSAYVGGTTNAIFGDIYLKEGSHVVAYVNDGKRVDINTSASPSANNYVSNGVDYSLVFNPTYYANKYADLKKAFGNNLTDLFNHFITYGMKEGRQARDNFNVNAYKNRYADLQNAFGNNLPAYYKHYVQYGYKEGRNAIANSTSTTSSTSTVNKKTMYRVQVGAYTVKANADRLLAEIKRKGYSDAFINTAGRYYKVQVGAYTVKSNADRRLAEIKKLGYTDAFITT